jgi:SAM-dependent methyltransferase
LADNEHKQWHSDKAADRGEPSYVWRDGQKRRMRMIEAAAGNRMEGVILEDGCGVGSYLNRMSEKAKYTIGIEIEFERGKIALSDGNPEQMSVVNSCGEFLPFASDSFDLVLSHEVIEHVDDDRKCIEGMIRCLKPGGRLTLFCPNRGYPFETHGIYWKGTYHFGNKFLVNYLPRGLRDKLAPHVNVYTSRDLGKLFTGLPVMIVKRTIIFGAYDNIINRTGIFGRLLRSCLQALEKTPLKIFGLSHFWVVEKV